jgi:hypothetical protein
MKTVKGKIAVVIALLLVIGAACGWHQCTSGG